MLRFAGGDCGEFLTLGGIAVTSAEDDDDVASVSSRVERNVH